MQFRVQSYILLVLMFFYILFALKNTYLYVERTLEQFLVKRSIMIKFVRMKIFLNLKRYVIIKVENVKACFIVSNI